MKVSRKQFTLFAIGILVLLYTIGALFFFISPNDKRWAFDCAVVCVVHYAFIMMAWCILKIPFFSPKSLFLLALVLFHEGNLIVAGLMNPTPEQIQYVMILYRYGDTRAFEAARYVMIFIFVYALFVLITHRDAKIMKAANSENPRRLRLIGKILLIAAIPATLYTDIKMIIARGIGGYIGVYEVDVTLYGIPLGYFTKMLFPAILLLLISYKDNKKVFQKIMIVAMLYYAVRMLLIGRKADSILALLPIIGIYYHFYRPKIKLWYIVVGYGALYLIVVTTKMRGMPVGANFIETLQKTIHETNPLKDLLIEMGGTIKTVIQAMIAIPETGSYRGGASYLWAIPGGLLQGLKIKIDAISSQTQMDLFFALPERGTLVNNMVYAMGGSAIAEWYFNFGWLGIFLIPVFVWLVNKFDRAFLASKGCNLKFVSYNILMFYFLRYSRAYIIEMVWNPFFCIVAIAVLNWMISRNKSHS